MSDPKIIIAQKLSELMAAVPSLGTQMKLAERTGIGQTTIGRIRAGKVNPTSEVLKQIADAFNVPVGFLYGEVDQHGEPITAFSTSTQAILQSGEDLAKRAPAYEDEQDPSEGGAKIPLISWVQAGAWSAMAGQYFAHDAEAWLYCPFKHGPSAFVLQVVGESMYNPAGSKSYAPGDFIAVDPDREAINRSMVIASIIEDNTATFKQLIVDPDGTKMLKAINPNWPRPFVEINGNAKILGTVIGKWVPE